MEVLLLPSTPPAPCVSTPSSPASGPPLTGAFGVLDAQGGAGATFTPPPASPPALVGLTAHHAYAVFDLTPLPGQPTVDLVSDAAPVQLVP